MNWSGTTGRYAFFIWQTIACVGNQKWNFPQFSIKPRGVWSRPGLGGRGIRFQAHPRFSARFKVKCADEAGARRFLVPLPLEELERFPDLVHMGALTIISNIYGNPAVSIPSGFLDGLPLGMQVLARHHADELLFDVALAAERDTPWPKVAQPLVRAALLS